MERLELVVGLITKGLPMASKPTLTRMHLIQMQATLEVVLI